MFAHLIKRFRPLLAGAAVASVISGACGVGLVIQINAALTVQGMDVRVVQAWTFAAFAVAAMLTRMISSVLFERLGQRANAELHRFVSSRVMHADLRRVEEVGSAHVHSALAEHSTRLAEFFVSLPNILVNVIIVIGCLLYMAWLSWPVFLVAALVLGLGSLGYHLAHLRAIRHLHIAAQEQDTLFGHFRSLVDGAKELRLHAAKRMQFARHVLDDSIESVRRERTLGMSIFVVSTAWGHFLVYAFIGLVLFVLVGDVPDRARIMTGFALVFVYMVAPLETLLIALPRANLAKASAARIDALIAALATGEPQSSPQVGPAFTGISLDAVCHRYYHEAAGEMFTLGPITLNFAPGQLDFLVGGNGSGKTTLAKLLAGLYRPEEGTIRVGAAVVDDVGRDAYRQHFTAIFTDFHLFERLLEAPSDALDARGNALLAKLNLQHKVQVRGGAFTTQALSQGQRKRLALVVAYLEDRPFLVFDEWAADQDPQFKEVFYRELLPELRARGKSVLVITHDDRYFHLADRIIRMESGQITVIEVRSRAATPSAGGVHHAVGIG